MKDNDVILNEVIFRAKEIEDNKRNFILKRNCFLSVTFIINLFISVYKIIEAEIPHHLNKELSYGSVIYTNDSISIYATIVVAMFVLGSIFTIILVKLKNKGG